VIEKERLNKISLPHNLLPNGHVIVNIYLEEFTSSMYVAEIR